MVVNAVRIEREVIRHNNQVITLKMVCRITVLIKLARYRRRAGSIFPDVSGDQPGRVGVLDADTAWKCGYEVVGGQQGRDRYLGALGDRRRVALIGKLHPRFTAFVERQLIDRHGAVQSLFPGVAETSATVSRSSPSGWSKRYPVTDERNVLSNSSLPRAAATRVRTSLQRAPRKRHK